MRRFIVLNILMFLITQIAFTNDIFMLQNLCFPSLAVQSMSQGVVNKNIFINEEGNQISWENKYLEEDDNSKYLAKKKIGRILVYIGIGAAAVGAVLIAGSQGTITVPKLSSSYIQGVGWLYFAGEETIRTGEELETPGYILLGLGVATIVTGLFIYQSAKKEKNSLLININPIKGRVEIGYILFLKH